MNTLHVVTVVMFWMCAAGVLYAYAVYPVIVYAMAWIFGRGRQAAATDDALLPSVSLLIAAHNEEAVIADRVKNAIAMDYPRGKLDILVASDGSSDQTANIVRQFAGDGVRVLDYTQRRGKAAVLNAARSEITAEIVLLSDANTNVDPDAVRSLVRWFADPRVGAVCGKLIITDPQTGKNVDSLYWRYETFLKTQEGRLGALLGSNGALYAIRRELLEPIPNNTIIDDFVIPLLAKLRSGCGIVYDPQAIAREESAPDVRTEFRRRSRIGAGGWQAIGMLWPLLDPRRGWVAFTFFSHKILRWLCPFLLAGMLLSAGLLWGSTGYRLLLVAQIAGYLCALIGARVPRGAPGARLLRLAHMFVSMNAALLVGFFRWASGPQTGMWARTPRTAEVQPAA